MASERRGANAEIEPSQSDHNSQPGASVLGRQQVADIQRARMLAAMVQEVAERGAGKVSVAHVVARSGVSRRTFYEVFEDREDCFLAAFDEAVARVAAVIVPAYEERGPWRVKMRTALTMLLELLDYDRGTGRLLIVESLGAGPMALEHGGRVFARIVAAIDEGRAIADADKRSKVEPPPPLTAEGIAGGVLSVIHARLTAKKRPGSLIDLAGPLMGMIVLPYLGPVAARREIEQPVPKARPKTRVVRRDPLRDLEMRLTYRTVRTLMAVAEHPGASNRTVGASAGIPDQGQVSKLLTRLHNLGLVDNTTAPSTRGGPNAWTLTARGWEIHGAIAERTASA
jgi:AcrR family transcriptional regulator